MVDPSHARAGDGYQPPVYYARRAPVHTGNITLDFLAVYDVYPNGHAKWQAAQAWQDLAESHPGGEKALRVAIEAIFKRGILRRPPYDRPYPYCPSLHTFLVERRWEDRIGDAPASAPLRVVRDELPDLPPAVRRPAASEPPVLAAVGSLAGGEGGGAIQGIASRGT